MHRYVIDGELDLLAQDTLVKHVVGGTDAAQHALAQLQPRQMSARATQNANMPLFVVITIADKMLFFLVWGIIQAIAIQRFVEHVPVRKVLAVKGGSELVRTVNNSLADAVFFEPGERGFERKVAERIAEAERLRRGS